MARLPQPGSDKGTWGNILNDFLGQVHQADGQLKDGVITEAKLDAAVQTKLNSGGGGSGAVSSVAGKTGAVTLVKADVGLGNVDNTSDASKPVSAATQTALNAKYTLPGSGIPESDLASAVQTKLNNPTVANGSVTAAKLSAGGASANQVLSYDGTGLAWTTPTGSGNISDATTGAKGIVQLAGDLGGTAAAPTVPGLAGKVDTTTQVATSGSLTGGGALSATRTLSLSGDSATPGNSKYYGTNGSGTKGFFDLPAGGSGAVTSVAGKTGVVTLVQGDIANLTADLGSKAADGAVVHNTGAETVAGVKTFSSSPVVPTPTTNTQAANKAYVDSAVSAGGGGGGSTYIVTAQSSNYTAVNRNYVIGNASSAGFNVTLPAVAANAMVSVKKVDNTVNAILVMAANGELIDDQVSISVNQQWMSYDFLSDGTKWYRI